MCVGTLAVARPVRAQNPSFQNVAQYVCQTPRFWCAFLFSAGVPDGSLCTCNTPYGFVAGFSLRPIQDQSAVPLPDAQRTTPPTGTTPVRPKTAGTPDKGECYNGLGNCSGSYSLAVARAQAQGQGGPSGASADLAGEWANDDGETQTITRQAGGRYRSVIEDEDEGGFAIFEFRVTGTRGTGSIRFQWPAADRKRCVGVTTMQAAVQIRVIDGGDRLELTARNPELNRACQIVYEAAETVTLTRR